MFDPIKSIIENSIISDHNEEVVVDHILNYYKELDMLEKKHEKENSKLDDAVSEKTKVFDKYWNTTDDYWRPCSTGGNEHNLKFIKEVSVMTDGNGSFIVTVDIENEENPFGSGKNCYLITSIDKKPKIINKFY